MSRTDKIVKSLHDPTSCTLPNGIGFNWETCKTCKPTDSQGIETPPEQEQPVNMCSPHPPIDERMQRVNDDLFAVRRMLDKPDVVIGSLEIMDLVRMSIHEIHRNYEKLATEIRDVALQMRDIPNGK